MLDRKAFVRPIAHRGLHNAKRGIIENTAPAFAAAMQHGYGIECDLRPASDGTPMVFHDDALARLVDAPGMVWDHTPAALGRMPYKKDPTAHVLSLAGLLELVGGRVPLLIEVKSEWVTPWPRFLARIARQLVAYKGPAAIMSFDPDVVAALKPLMPDVPRGVISGAYDKTWWPGLVGPERAYRLTHLLESRAAAPDFYAYDVKALPTPVTRFVREALGLPLFTWTVRSPANLKTARQWADAPIFEGLDPAG